MIEAQGLVLVKLNIEFSFTFSYTGILACLDGYMNIAMEQTEEYVNGKLKNKYGDALALRDEYFAVDDDVEQTEEYFGADRPALAVSFFIAGVAAALSACCYAELASCCPSAGSAYHYAYIFLEKGMY
ncbi:hypothetical protein HID58_044080 [Brassica napus]|uniref:Sm domain-containing protein n=2 Tax=Brassica napus TaxID=3708 RepID=A0ABQ8BID0_BRANA|nr:hypothetical protein HID58_044080 [Brassica napus]CDY32332.1 BnaC01g36510D [Brassica napus]